MDTMAKQRHRMAIIVASPLTKNIYERIGANTIARVFDVIVIDCLDWLRNYNRRPEYCPVDAPNIYNVDSEESFIKLLQEFAPTYVMDFIGRGEYTRRIQEICHSFSALYITHLLSPFPNPIRHKTVLRSLLHNPIKTIASIYSYAKRRLYQKQPIPPDIALLAGTESINSWTGSAGKIIHTATPAWYDLNQAFRTADELPNLPINDYILFIDDCLPLSFDFLLGNHKPIIDSSIYFPLLNRFLTEIEARFDLPVVVAAHPNGKEFPGYEDYFENRHVYFDATAALSVNCRFAMTHFSSAMNYIVLLRKPLLLMNFKQLKRQPQGLSVDYITNLLDCQQVDIEEPLDPKVVSLITNNSINEFAYQDYEKKYISSIRSVTENPFETLIQYLLSLDGYAQR